MADTLVLYFHVHVLISFVLSVGELIFLCAALCCTCMAHCQCVASVCAGCMLAACQLTTLLTKFCRFITLFCLTLPYVCVLQLLTNHYEQNWKYYCLPSGWGSYGTASEDELLLTKKIFWGVFDSLSQRVRGHSCIAQNVFLIRVLYNFTVTS